MDGNLKLSWEEPNIASLVLSRAALSCLMAPVTVTKEIKALQKLIPDDVIYSPDNPDYGREVYPHITVLFGLVTEDIEAVKRVVQDSDPIDLVFDNKTSIFEPDLEYDVVKVAVKSPQLFEMNKKLQDKFEVKTDHKEYKPHLTIAYVKKGKGKKYDGLSVSLPNMKLDTLDFSNHNHDKTSFSIQGKKASLVLGSVHTDYLKEHEIEERSVGLGFSEKEQKWYGWSHRAIQGFGVGDKPSEPSPTGDSALDKKINTMQEAEEAARNFAEAVSSQKPVNLSLKVFSAKGDIIVNLPVPGGEGTLQGKVIYRKDKKGGTTAYYYDAEGKLHREGKPAIIGPKEEAYYNHGLLHNEEGPARILSNGTKEYWLNGKPLTQEDWTERRGKEELLLPDLSLVEKKEKPSLPEINQISIKDLSLQNVPGDIWQAHLLSGRSVYFTFETIEHVGEKEITGYGKYSLYEDDISKHDNTRFTIHDYDGPFKKVKKADIMPESSLELPGGESYQDSDLMDIQFDEKVKHSPTVRKEDQDIVKYRLDLQNEEKFFEKGLHQKVNMPQVTRPIVPYGSLKLSWEEDEFKVGDKVRILSKSIGASLVDSYTKVGDTGKIIELVVPGTKMWEHLHLAYYFKAIKGEGIAYHVICSSPGGGVFLQSDLELVEKTSILSSLKLCD
jgi:hypothetical protein